MADQTLSSNPDLQTRRAIRRLGPFVAFALLMALGFALRATEGARFELQTEMTQLVRLGLNPAGLAGALDIATAGLGLLALVVGQGLVVILALLAIEAALAGPPKRWSTVGFALALQTLTVLFYFLAGPFIARVLPWDVGIAPLVVISERALPALLQPAVPILGALLLILFMTFGSYWAHRALHRFPALWRFHAVHHSVEDMDAANSYVHPVDVLVERAVLIALGIVLKVDFETFIWAAAFTAFNDRMIHSRSPINFGPLGVVLLDNRHHFIHHSRDPAHFDRNFGGYFTLWDRVFGTYFHPPSDALVPTGLTDRKPPGSVWQFATGRLEPRDEA